MIIPINLDLVFGTTASGSNFVPEDFVVVVVIGLIWFQIFILSNLRNV